MKKPNSSFILFIIFSIVFTQNTIAQESPYDELWKIVEADTFPFLRSHDEINKVADISLIPVLALKIGKKVESNQIAQAYYYNLLAGRFDLCDSIISYLQPTDSAYIHLLGHMALKEYVPCFGESNPECDSIRKKVYPLLKEAAEKSNLMPWKHWEWMSSIIDSTHHLENSTIDLLYVDDSLQQSQPESWEGAIIRFNLTPDKQNLLISNGSLKALQLLELDSNQKWIDISEQSGVNDIPGGHLLYNIDYNSDGLDDILVLRKSSDQRSPAIFYSSLLSNNGDGTFSDVSKEMGLNDIRRPLCACWGDINQDGKLDVFIGDELKPSTWMVQNNQGKFENKAYSYNVLTKDIYVLDCKLNDFNQDGLQDLYLTLRRDSNMLFIQEPINDSFFYFTDQSSKYELKEPTFSNQVITFDFGMDGKNEFLIQSDYLGIHQVIADVLIGEDTIIGEPSLFFTILNDTTYKNFTLPEIPLIRAGVILENPSQSILIAGGGTNTESLYPAFIFDFNAIEQITTQKLPQHWPAYVHSITSYADSLDQPILVFKGGGSYPFMINKQSSYQIKMPVPGKFERLFHYNKSIIGTSVTFDYHFKNGDVKKLTRNIQALDSKGYAALQEWIWVNEGDTISNIQYAKKDIYKMEETPSQPEEKRKRNKKK